MTYHITLRAEEGLNCVAVLVDEVALLPVHGSTWAQNRPNTLCVADLTREEVLLTAEYQSKIVLAVRDERTHNAIDLMRTAQW